MLKHIFKHTFFYTLANQLPSLVNIFLLPIFSKYLSTTDYALFGLIWAFIGLIGAFNSLGYIVNFQNEFFHSPDNYAYRWKQMLGFLWVYKGFYSVVVIGILYFLLQFHLQGSQLWTVIALVIIPILFFDLTKAIGIRLCQFRHEHRKVYTISIISAFLAIGINYVCIVWFQLGFISWIISQAIGGLIQAIYFGHMLYVREKLRPVFTITRKEVLADLKVSLPIIPQDYANYILASSDRVILERSHTSMQSIGQYNVAYAFASYFEHVQSQANMVITPIFFNLFKANKPDVYQVVAKYIKLWFYISLSMAAVLGIWIPNLFKFLYRKEELAASYPMAVILVFAFCFRPLFAGAIDQAIFEKKTVAVLKISLVAATLNLVMNFTLIPFYGVYAAAFSTVVSYGLLGFLGYYMISSNKTLRTCLNLPLLLGVLLAVLFSVRFISEESLWLKLAATAGIGVALISWFFMRGKQIIQELGNR